MKRADSIRPLLLLCIIAAMLGASCKKGSCNNVNCQNGGSCSDGGCACPFGYSGQYCQYAPIYFQNNTHTPVVITMNDSTQVIAVDSSVTFTDSAGATENFTAYTAGVYAPGDTLGDKITWSLTETFPSEGNLLTVPINVSNTYFYLSVINSSSYATTSLVVNPNLSSEVTSAVAIPSDGNVHGIGYYPSAASVVVEAYLSGAGTYTTSSLFISGALNTSATAPIQ